MFEIIRKKYLLQGIMLLFTFGVSVTAMSAELPKTPSDITLFTVNEFEGQPGELQLSLSVPSQCWVRPLFKWANAPNLQPIPGYIADAHKVGALFGGGVTCSALYQHENGITESQFMDMATRDPFGKLYMISNSYYHGSLENPAYRKYVLKWAEAQIDVGVDTLFMDEVNGAYSWNEGYDFYGLAAFREYLFNRYVKKAHWSVTDKRWRTIYKVDFNDPNECPDHTIRTFDYAAYLRVNRWASNPDQSANPFLNVWGSPADISGDSYSAWRNNTTWRYWVDHLRAYAKETHHRVWIAANGLNKWVDFQISGVWGNFPPIVNGNMDCTVSYLPTWRALYNRSKELLHGRDTSIMVFHDWGDGMPWMNLTDDQRVAWLHAYEPEIFASGLFFAFPVHGPFNCDASTNGTLSIIKHQAKFVESIAPLLHHVTWEDPSLGSFTGNAEITIQAQPQYKRLIVHLINRNYKGMSPIEKINGVLKVALIQTPSKIILHDADTGASQILKGEYLSNERLPQSLHSGVISLRIPDLRTWDVVELELRRWVAMPPLSVITIPCSPNWSRPTENLFKVSQSTNYSLDLNGFVQGQLHPDLRNNPTFLVHFKQPSVFQIHVNSVATAGGELIVKLDGKRALTKMIADKDGKNDSNAEEINHTYSVRVPAGDHRIKVDNIGGDWFTVDWYRFKLILH